LHFVLQIIERLGHLPIACYQFISFSQKSITPTPITFSLYFVPLLYSSVEILVLGLREEVEMVVWEISLNQR
jgi:hypothetical protein